MSDSKPWSLTVTFPEVARGLPTQNLEADAAARKAIAKTLGLVAISSLTAQVVVRPWLDGAELLGRLDATVTQTCSVSADDFDETLRADFTVKVLPPGSPNAPANDSPEGLDLDLEADDPPDVAEDNAIDLAAYVTEHLALELDPFPRKPGAEYEPPPEEKPASPFAVLGKLRPPESKD